MKSTAHHTTGGDDDDAAADTDRIIVQSLAKLDWLALGVALGALFGAIIFLATNFLVIKGGAEIGPTLSLLGHYFAGYQVTPFGSLIGAVYGFIAGFATGTFVAALRNSIVAAYLYLLKLKGNLSAVNDFIDNP